MAAIVPSLSCPRGLWTVWVQGGVHTLLHREHEGPSIQSVCHHDAASRTLVNISPYMKTFFANKTYLERDDPELFTKLATHLENARDSEEEDADNDPWEYRQ